MLRIRFYDLFFIECNFFERNIVQIDWFIFETVGIKVQLQNINRMLIILHSQ